MSDSTNKRYGTNSFRETQEDLQGIFIRGGPTKYCFNYHIQSDGMSF